jgi:hypothetical protein
MIVGGKDKPEAVAADAVREVRRGKLDTDAEFLKHIRAPALGGDGPVAVFDHAGASGGQNEHAGGGDVEKVEPVSAGPTDIQKGPGEGLERDGNRFCKEAAGERGDFGGGLPFFSEGLEKIDFFGGWGLGLEQGVEGFQGLGVGEVLGEEEARGEVREHGGKDGLGDGQRQGGAEDLLSRISVRHSLKASASGTAGESGFKELKGLKELKELGLYGLYGVDFPGGFPEAVLVKFF